MEQILVLGLIDLQAALDQIQRYDSRVRQTTGQDTAEGAQTEEFVRTELDLLGGGSLDRTIAGWHQRLLTSFTLGPAERGLEGRVASGVHQGGEHCVALRRLLVD